MVAAMARVWGTASAHVLRRFRSSSKKALPVFCRCPRERFLTDGCGGSWSSQSLKIADDAVAYAEQDEQGSQHGPPAQAPRTGTGRARCPVSPSGPCARQTMEERMFTPRSVVLMEPSPPSTSRRGRRKPFSSTSLWSCDTDDQRAFSGQFRKQAHRRSSRSRGPARRWARRRARAAGFGSSARAIGDPLPFPDGQYFVRQGAAGRVLRCRRRPASSFNPASTAFASMPWLCPALSCSRALRKGRSSSGFRRRLRRYPRRSRAIRSAPRAARVPPHLPAYRPAR